MLDLIVTSASWAAFLSGGFFVFVGALGVVRFPDFYARTHAAGVTDTLGADLIILGMVLQAPDFITGVKLFFMFSFILLTSPVATHAIAHAAWVRRLNPLIGAELRYAETDEECGRADAAPAGATTTGAAE